MTPYNPKTTFRQTSNALLREHFEKKACPLNVPWDDLGERQIQGTCSWELRRIQEIAVTVK